MPPGGRAASREVGANRLVLQPAEQFDRLGVFTYSDEEGTPAFDFDARVSQRVKSARRARLMAVARKLSLRRNRALVGGELDVLVEGRAAEDATRLSVGRSYRDAPEVDGVVLLEADLVPGQIVRARVERALEYDLVARPVGAAVPGA